MAIKKVHTELAFHEPLLWQWKMQAPNRNEVEVTVPTWESPLIILMERQPIDLITGPIKGYNDDTLWKISIPTQYRTLYSRLMFTQEDQSRIIGTIVDMLRNLYASGNRTGVYMQADTTIVMQNDPLQVNPPLAPTDLPGVALRAFAEDNSWQVEQWEDDENSATGSPIEVTTVLTFPSV